MVADSVAQIAPWAIITGVGGWMGNAIVQWMRSRDSRHSTDRTTDAKLEEHRDSLTFQLLEAARVEVAELRVEVHRLRPMEHHLIHFDEALRHLEELLVANTGEPLAVAKRNAQAFLNRVRRMREATGTLRNELQRLQSQIDLEHGNMTSAQIIGPGSEPEDI
jgi:nucleoside-diphosphate-sugar epimerase